MHNSSLKTDPQFRVNFVDSTALDNSDESEAAAMDEILQLYQQDAFGLRLPYSVQEEIDRPDTPGEVKRRAEHLIVSKRVDLIDQELRTYDRIRGLIGGGVRRGGRGQEAFHLFESAKYGAQNFITNNTCLLEKAGEI